MDDLRKLLGQQQQELEQLQRKCDARAANGRKAPASPHLVQLRKLHATLTRQRRYLEALEVLRTLENLEWRELEGTEEAVRRQNESQLEAMLLRHERERQVLEAHLLRAQPDPEAAVELASHWDPSSGQQQPPHCHRKLRARGCVQGCGEDDVGRGPCSPHRPCSPSIAAKVYDSAQQLWAGDSRAYQPSCCWEARQDQAWEDAAEGAPVWAPTWDASSQGGTADRGSPAVTAASSAAGLTALPSWESCSWGGFVRPCTATRVRSAPPGGPLLRRLSFRVESLSEEQASAARAAVDGSHCQLPERRGGGPLGAAPPSSAPAAASSFDQADWEVFSALQEAAQQWYAELPPSPRPVAAGPPFSPPPWPPGFPPQRAGQHRAPIHSRYGLPASPLAQRLAQLRGPTRAAGALESDPVRRGGPAGARSGHTPSSYHARSTQLAGSPCWQAPQLPDRRHPQGAPHKLQWRWSGGDVHSMAGAWQGGRRFAEASTSDCILANGIPRQGSSPAAGLTPPPSAWQRQQEYLPSLPIPQLIAANATFMQQGQHQQQPPPQQQQQQQQHGMEAAFPAANDGSQLLPQQPTLQPPLKEPCEQQSSCICWGKAVSEGQQQQQQAMQCSIVVPAGAAKCLQGASDPAVQPTSQPPAVLPDVLQPQSAAQPGSPHSPATITAQVFAGAARYAEWASASSALGSPPTGGLNGQQHCPHKPPEPVGSSSLEIPRGTEDPKNQGPQATPSVKQPPEAPVGEALSADEASAGVATADAAGAVAAAGVAAAEEVLEHCRHGRYEEARQLLKDTGLGIDVPRDTQGSTPLMLACAGGHGRLVKLCLRKGAALDTRNAAGDTPLLLAAAAGHKAVTRYLLQAGADPLLKNTAGVSAEELILQWSQHTACDTDTPGSLEQRI